MMAYVVRLRGCGCVVYAGTDREDQRSGNARAAAEAIRDGDIVERVTVSQARALPWECERCKDTVN